MGAGQTKMIWPILLFGLILRLISINQSLWLDEAINALAVKNYSFFNLITEYAKADFHPPGWFIILWFWAKAFGYSEVSLRAPSVIFGILSIFFTYLVGKKLVSGKIGLVAALLIAINPLHIYYSQEARMYSLATLAVLINVLLFIKLAKGEKINTMLTVVSNVLVLTSDYIAYFIFPAQLAFLLLVKKEALKKWCVALSIAVLLGIWWLPTFLSQFDVGSVASANLPTWKFINGAFDFKTLPLTYVKFIIGRISLADKFVYAAILLPVCTFFGYLLWKGFKSQSGLVQKLLITWIFIPLILATAISFIVPVYNYFRVLYVLPAFIILLSLGILSFEKRKKYIFLSTVVLIELFCTSIYLLNPAYHRENWRGLVKFFENKDTLVIFESSGTLPPFDYYAKGIKTKGALRDFPVKDEKDVINMDDLSKDVYLVDYLVEISDPNRLVAKKLVESGYKQTEIRDFTGVGFIYHYVKE